MNCLHRRTAERGSACTDAQLVGLLRDGEQRAFDELHDRHGPALRAYVTGMLRGRPESEDIVQDVFMRAVRTLRDGQQAVEDVRPWLFRVAYNRTIDVIRATRPTSELGEHAAHLHDPASVLDANDELRRTMTALRALPDSQRRALVLNAVHGESYATVARALDTTPQAAKALAYRGRASARRALSAA